MQVQNLEEQIDKLFKNPKLRDACKDYFDSFGESSFYCSTIHELLALRVASRVYEIENASHECLYIGWSDYPCENEQNVLTKLGGWPYLNRMDWPKCKDGQYLSFVCQIETAGIAGLPQLHGNLIQIFAKSYGSNSFERMWEGISSKYTCRNVTLGLEPVVRIANSNEPRINYDYTKFPTISEIGFEGLRYISNESPTAKGFEDSTYKLHNIPVTKVCPDYWGSCQHRFFGDSRELFVDGSIPFMQIMSHSPRSDAFHLLWEIAKSDKNWYDYKEQVFINIGDGFSFIISHETDGTVEASYLT